MIARAREIHVLDYILTYESNSFKRVGNTYRHKEHNSLAVNDKGWYWHSQRIGNVSALNYLIEAKGYGFVDAVSMLTCEKPTEYPIGKQSTHQSNLSSYKHSPHFNLFETLPPSSQRTPLVLPRRNKDNRRIIAYLQSRGIDRNLILACIERGNLYESAVHHNVVFLGRDEQDRTRYAALRSITGRFMRDADGSDKRYGFTIPSAGNTGANAVAVFESAIDALSHQTLCDQGFIPPFDGWRLSLGGTSLLALNHFLDSRPEVSLCVICTDNDDAGNTVATKIADTIRQNVVCQRAPPIHGLDYNDTLLAMQQTRRLDTPATQKDSSCL